MKKLMDKYNVPTQFKQSLTKLIYKNTQRNLVEKN